jgi:hypothetical protein
MSIQVVAELFETYINDETFTIEKLPDNWDDLGVKDRYLYISVHGKYIESDSQFSELIEVNSVEEEA